MSKGTTFAYRVGNNLYINLTNRCSSACVFCLRNSADGVGEADTLWLDHEPSVSEVMAAISAFAPDSYGELVFCGYGEPTMALEVLLEVAKQSKERWGKKIRLNTNGQASLIAKRDIAPELVGLIDCVSISLNTPNPATYLELTRSAFGTQAFPALLDFAKECAEVLPEVVLTTVETTISKEEEQQCAEICAKLGVKYRIRPWVD